MKSINRTISVCTILLVSLTFISSLFFLLTTDVQAKNRLAVNVSGPITTNTTWTVANSPYILTDEVIVNEGITLTIEPGVMVMGQEGTVLGVNGRLEAIGTLAQPITFTSVASSVPGGWTGLFIGLENDTGSAHLDHVVVQYGEYNLYIDPLDGAPTTIIENTYTQFSENHGIVIGNWALHLVELDNVTFADNGKNRIQISTIEGPPLLTGNPILTTQPGLEGYEVDFYSSNSGEFEIPVGITLTLEPGVTFFMPEASSIIVNGRLEAIGTPSQPITFTSAANSGPGEWEGLYIGNEGDTGSAHLNHVVVQNAKYNIVFDPLDGALTTKIENTITQFSENHGMVIGDWALNLVELDNVTFANNGKNRIQIYAIEGPALLPGSTILTAQPGLEGYEIDFLNPHPMFLILEGITLTIEPGLTIFMPDDSSLVALGRLEAIGMPSQPITFTSSVPNHSWTGLYTEGEGSAHLNHTVVEHGRIGIYSSESAPLTKIENSLIQDSQDVPLDIRASALHLVKLVNVTFVNNSQNRILIWHDYDEDRLIDNATLTAQPGLEGYEIDFLDYPLFEIPVGITLTIEPDVTIFMPDDSLLVVTGRLEAIGMPSQPITFTSSVPNHPWAGLFTDREGSAHLNHAVVEYGQIGIYASESAPLTKIENSLIQDSQDYPMDIWANVLHLVELDNVTFVNNFQNRILIWYDDTKPLIDNAALTAQPGLEGYQVGGSYSYNEFSISEGITLTIAPDVTLFMPENKMIEVNGRLEAIGTPSQPITFTSTTTDTYPWKGIVVNGGSTDLTHATIQRSKENGLSILDGSVTARCTTITDNLGSGIFVDAAASANIQLQYNSLVSNTVAGLRYEGASWLDARYTWWGAVDGPSGNGPGSGDAVTGNVHYDPWLTEPACHEVESVNLEAAQTASSAVITPSETLTYTITVTNHAETTATQVILTDTLPANVTLLTAPANCSGSTELVCTLADLADGEQTSFTIQVQANLTETAVLTNTIDVLAAQPDLNFSLNHSILTTIVEPEISEWEIFLPMVIKPD